MSDKRSHYVVPALLSVCLLMGMALSSCGKSARQTDRYDFYEKVMDTSKPIAVGTDRDIYILCDETNWKLVESALRENLEQQRTVVSKEQYFELHRSDIKQLETLTRYKNLIFIGDLQSKSAVSRHIRNTLPPNVLQKVQARGADMLSVNNRWVKDQLVIYMVASQPDLLVRLLQERKNKLFDLLLERLADRLAYQAFLTKLIPEDFFAAYPFTLKVPETYQIFSNDKQNRFLSLLFRSNQESRETPDKYLSVYYEDMPENKLDGNWLLDTRKRLAWHYYDEDEIDPASLHPLQIVFGNYTAWYVMGAWKNQKHLMGGGFQAFALYEPNQKKAYLIDNSVYYPTGDKLPVLLELWRISQTFTAR